MRASWLLIFMMFALFTVSAQAGLYRWVDEYGAVHYGDAVPAKYLKKEHEELNEQGTMVKKHDRAMTAEEKEEKKREEAERKRLENEKRAQALRDRVLTDTYTTERDETVDFSCSYVTIGQVLLVRSDESRFSNPDEFQADESLKASTQITPTNEIAAHEFIGVDRTLSFEDFGLATQALLSGDVDAMVVDTITALGYMDENPGKLKIIQPNIQSDEQLALVFPPGSDLIDPFNAALAAMASDGKLQELNDKWFNP